MYKIHTSVHIICRIVPHPDIPTRLTARPGLLDRIGIGLSGLCVLHCLLMPLAIATLPLWGMALHAHELVHPIFAGMLIPVTGLAVRTTRRNLPGDRRIPVFLLSGLAVILLAFSLHAPLGELVEAVLTLIGSSLLISGHVLNWRARTQHGAACEIA